MRRPVLRDLQGEHKEAPWVPEYQAPPCHRHPMFPTMGRARAASWPGQRAQPSPAKHTENFMWSSRPAQGT